MKRVVSIVLVLVMVMFLVNPLSSDARGGGRGGGRDHWDDRDWWVPVTVIGGLAVIGAAVWAYCHSHYARPPVIIQEEPPVHFQPAPSVQPSMAERLFVYPRKGQSQELQAKDTYECNSWAVGQTNYDPTQLPGGVSSVQKRADYNKAMAACLDARGYTAK